MEIVSIIIGILLTGLFAGVVIWIVGRLGWGIEVSGFMPAFLAAILIAILSGLVTWLLNALGITISGGLIGALINLVISALVLMVAGKFIKGLVVKGFTGALIAALAIAFFAWLIGWLIGLFT